MARAGERNQFLMLNLASQTLCRRHARNPTCCRRLRAKVGGTRPPEPVQMAAV